VHVGDEPFMRMELTENQSYRPIDVMAGTRVKFECEVVSRADSRRFVARAFGATHESLDCQDHIDVPQDIGRKEELVIDFFDGAVTEPTDTIRVPLAIVPAGARIAFHGLEDEHGQPVRGVNVPARVKVFARAMAQLDESIDPVALFFVADSVDGVPVLQLAPVKEGQKEILPNVGPVVRYRSFGPDLGGYAIWSDGTIVVGRDEPTRQVKDIYVGIFAAADVPKVLEKTLSVSVRDESTLSVTPLVQDIESVAAMTLGGRMMSAPLHVVRNIEPTILRSVP